MTAIAHSQYVDIRRQPVFAGNIFSHLCNSMSCLIKYPLPPKYFIIVLNDL